MGSLPLAPPGKPNNINSSVQSLSCVQLFVIPWTAGHQTSLSITNPELAQSPVHQVSDAIQPSHPLLSPSPPALTFPSIRISSNESVLPNRWPKYWSLSFSINPSNDYSGLISFRIDWFDLLAVQGTQECEGHYKSTYWRYLSTGDIYSNNTGHQPQCWIRTFLYQI